MSLFADALASFRVSEGRPRTGRWSWNVPVVEPGSINLVAELTASYEQIYHSQPWVWASVNKLARSVGMLPLKVYVRGAEEARTRLYDGDLYDLLKHPFTPGGTPSYWKQHLVGSVCLWGNGFVVKMGATGPEDMPEELFPAPAVGWTVGESETYVWTSEKGERFVFPRWQVMHFRYWDTTANGFGVSALEPLRRTLALEDAAQRFSLAAFQNGVNPAAVVNTDQTLTDAVLARLRGNIENLYGSVDKAFRVAVLEQGLDWKPLTHNLKDSALVEHRQLTREEIAAVFDIPQPSIGILEEANFASIDALTRMFWQGSIAPWLRLIEESIASEFVSQLPSLERHFVEFDENMMLRGTPLQRAEMHQRMYTSRVTTPNEMRAIEGYEPILDDPSADRLYLPPGSGQTAPDAATGEGEN